MIDIVVIGLILVALMVYASTRIKRTAAAAFEAETIETADFTVEKPAGFLHVISGDPKYAFEAYSKTFGTEMSAKWRSSRAFLVVSNDKSEDELAGETIDEAAAVVDDRTEIIGGQRYRIVETKHAVGPTEFRTLARFATKDARAYAFRITRLAETDGEDLAAVEAMFDSFAVK